MSEYPLNYVPPHWQAIKVLQAQLAEAKQEIAKANARGVSPWIPADKELPGNARCVLATDLEAHFIAVYWNDVWTNAHTSDEIDSVITHWMELPEVPE
jgi:hypothetical protein